MPEGSCAFSVGSIRCTVLSDGYTAYPAEWYFANVDPGQVRRALSERKLPTEDVVTPYSCLLIENGRHVILFDTGAGPGSRTSGAVLARLECAGLRPHHVDTVVLSHAHPDHAGGTVDDCGRPVFANARHVLTETEWNFWTGHRTDLRAMDVPDEVRRKTEAAARRSLAALRFQAELINREVEIAPGVFTIPAPGHTPGHMALLIASEGRQMLAIGDAALHPLHLEQPEWNNALDLAPDCASVTRRVLLERAGSERMHVMAFHFPFPSVGRVEARAAGGWHWSPGW
jgi:glyoxylase-like metal-dependent hydrolase (beta-lactamase superfamily II)